MSGSSIVPGFDWADLRRRTFAALSRDGSYYHLVHPVAADDFRVTREDSTVKPGDLVCECAGGRNRGTCYKTKEAIAALPAEPETDESWFERSPEFYERSEGQATA